MRKITLLVALLLFINSIYSQKILSEEVNYYDITYPTNPFDKEVKTYMVKVETPYTLTAEDVREESLKKFEDDVKNYESLVSESEIEYEKQLSNFNEAVALAEKKYDKEMENFNSLSMLERLAATEQGNKPKLVLPQKPNYIKPSEPVFREPNLNEHLIFDEQVLADGIELKGYEKGNPDVMFLINISKMEFKDNAGQTFYKQPTTLKVFKGPELLQETNFNDEFQFLTASSSNTINLQAYEKNNVTKILSEIEKYLNNNYGYQPYQTKMLIEYVKNNDREYDALENAKIKAISAYRKLDENATIQDRERAKNELLAAIDVWNKELEQVNYSDKKSRINADVAKTIYFNILRVRLTLNDKQKAEEVLKQIQNHRIDLDFNNREERTFIELEEKIYKM